MQRSVNTIITAGTVGLASPSKSAEVVTVLLDSPPGTNEAVAQGLQAAVNMAVTGAGEFIGATVRQHGKSPAVAINEMQINIKIQQDSQNDKQKND